MARPRSKADKQAAADAEAVVQQLMNRTQPGLKEHESRVRRFNRAYQVWRGPVMPLSRTGPNSWRSTLHVKYGMQIVDQASANLAEGIPSVRCLPRRPGDEGAADALENILNYFADLDHLPEKEIPVTQNALIYAVSAGKVDWCYDEDSSGRVIEDRPRFTPWDPYNIWWDPYADSVDSASYIVLRSYLTKTELEKMRYHPGEGDQGGYGSYRNLDLLYESGDAPKPDQTQQNKLLQPPEGLLRDRFEVLEFWWESPAGLQCSVVGNRKILLRDGASPYRMRSKPVVISNSRPDLFRIEGIAETEIIDSLQRALNEIGQLRLDQMKMTVLRGATVRETTPDIRQLVFRPGFLWPVQDHDDVKMVEPGSLPPEAYKEDEVLLGRMQYISGITPYISGSSAAGAVDQGTATGTTLLTQNASKLLQLKAQVIHNKTWQRLFEQWAALSRQFVADGTAVRILGPQKQVDWKVYSRGDIDADVDVRLEAGERSATVAQARAEVIQLLQTLAPFAAENQVNLKPVLEKVAKLWGFLSPQELIPQAQPQQQSAAPNGGDPTQVPGSMVGENGSTLGGQVTPLPLSSVFAGNQR